MLKPRFFAYCSKLLRRELSIGTSHNHRDRRRVAAFLHLMESGTFMTNVPKYAGSLIFGEIEFTN